MSGAIGIFRRKMVTSAAVGAAAGCMSTWFEMSHGIVCIPVITLPPLALTHHVAIGSTLVGVAGRQVLSAALYFTDQDVDISSEAALEQLVDSNAATGMAIVGSIAAASSAALAKKASPKILRRANGAFMMLISLFLYWRESKVAALRLEDEGKAETEEHVPEVILPYVPVPPPPPQPVSTVAVPLAPRVEGPNLREEHGIKRLLAMGAGAGFILGFFGIGPAWMMTPLLRHLADLDKEQSEGDKTQGPQPALPESPTSTAAQPSQPVDIDERLRLTCTVAMVPPSLVAAWYHFSLGHVPNVTHVALPLAFGAIAGSAFAGIQLADVPCDEEFIKGLSFLLFGYGAWSIGRPH
mmetsp:Transcript_54193/g.117098  ORF Transcript_54193/g.117098 Transcript_54193/m.117098 type:complete len:353 (-) Transcript_54193:94-1152(-)